MASQRTRYKQLIKEVVSEWADAGQAGSPPVRTLVSFDDEHENYLMVGAGWEHGKRHHDMIFHTHIAEGRVWSEWDGTSPSISEELLRRGIPDQEMVLN